MQKEGSFIRNLTSNNPGTMRSLRRRRENLEMPLSLTPNTSPSASSIFPIDPSTPILTPSNILAYLTAASAAPSSPSSGGSKRHSYPATRPGTNDLEPLLKEPLPIPTINWKTFDDKFVLSLFSKDAKKVNQQFAFFVSCFVYVLFLLLLMFLY